MGADEEGTLERLKALRREFVDPRITEHYGRIVKTTGTQPWSAVEWIADTQLTRPSVLLGLRHALVGILKALHLTDSEPQSRMWRDGNSYSATKDRTHSGPSSSMLSCGPKTPQDYRE